MKKPAPAALAIIIIALGSLISLYIFRQPKQNPFSIISNKWRRQPAIVQELNTTAADREKDLTALYISHRIPQPLAALTAKIDRIENDIARLSATLNSSPAASVEEEKVIRAAIKEKELESRTVMKANDALLDKYAEKARRAKDPEITRLVHVLKSRSFLFERAA